jgi:hypothetical protein
MINATHMKALFLSMGILASCLSGCELPECTDLKNECYEGCDREHDNEGDKAGCYTSCENLYPYCGR